MEETEFAQGECSHPPLQDDVSDYYLYDISDIYDYDIFEYYDSYHVSPIQPKWDEKTIEAAGDLTINPLDPRKTISQFHIAFSASEVVLSGELFMMVVSNNQSYQ